MTKRATILRRAAWLPLVGWVVASACRSGAPTPPPAGAPSPPPDLLKGFAGQTMIFRHQGDEKTVTVQASAIAGLKGNCDTVVNVGPGAFDRGTVRFTLTTLGRPRVGGRGSHQEACDPHDQPQVQLTVSGFSLGPTQADVEVVLGQLLQTPEAYLRAHGMMFDLQPSKAPPTAVSERVLTTAPQRLLWADASRADTARKIHYEGEVEVEGVVGVDGRLYDAKVLTPLKPEQEESVRAVLPVWRFQPGRKGTEGAAAVVREKLVFKIYY